MHFHPLCLLSAHLGLAKNPSLHQAPFRLWMRPSQRALHQAPFRLRMWSFQRALHQAPAVMTEGSTCALMARGSVSGMPLFWSTHFPSGVGPSTPSYSFLHFPPPALRMVLICARLDPPTRILAWALQGGPAQRLMPFTQPWARWAPFAGRFLFSFGSRDCFLSVSFKSSTTYGVCCHCCVRGNTRGALGGLQVSHSITYLAAAGCCTIGSWGLGDKLATSLMCAWESRRVRVGRVPWWRV